MSECADCGREGTHKMRWAPAFGLPGASSPAVCIDVADCNRAKREREEADAYAYRNAEEEDRGATWETSTEHDALQGVIPLEGDVTQGALL